MGAVCTCADSGPATTGASREENSAIQGLDQSELCNIAGDKIANEGNPVKLFTINKAAQSLENNSLIFKEPSGEWTQFASQFRCE